MIRTIIIYFCFGIILSLAGDFFRGVGYGLGILKSDDCDFNISVKGEQE